MLKKDLPLGVVLYEGPSLIDGKPIVVIANGFKGHENAKIGKMIQTWILRSDVHPFEALNNGEDFSICGHCKHRHFKSCYVNVMQGPAAVYRAYKAGRYAKYDISLLDIFRGNYMRLGAYGDPAAVPTKIWQLVCSVGSGHTGYTHRWKQCDPALLNFCMASVDCIQEYKEAQKRGFRTFRIRLQDGPVMANEFVCPNSKEMGKKSNCGDCRGCSGLMSDRKNPVIIIHGIKHKIVKFMRGMKLFKAKQKYARALLFQNR